MISKILDYKKKIKTHLIIYININNILIINYTTAVIYILLWIIYILVIYIFISVFMNVKDNNDNLYVLLNHLLIKILYVNTLKRTFKTIRLIFKTYFRVV